MKTEDVIAGLNEILSLEYASLLQYLQHSYLIQGPERAYLRGFFRERAQDTFEGHTKLIGDKIVALGGVPSVEPATIRQSTDIIEMLQQALEAERTAREAQEALLVKVQDDVPLRVMLEEMILDEQQEIDELEMLLAQKKQEIASNKSRQRESA